MKVVSAKIWNSKPVSTHWKFITKLTDLGVVNSEKRITGAYVNVFYGPQIYDEYGVLESNDFYLSVSCIIGENSIPLFSMTNSDLVRQGTSGGAYYYKVDLSDLNLSVKDAQLKFFSPVWPGNLFINDFGLEYVTRRDISTNKHDED